MGETYRIEVEIDGRCQEALESEAARLGVGVSEVMTRAVAAWLGDMREGAVTTKTVAAIASAE